MVYTPFGFSSGDVAVVVDYIFPLRVLGPAIKGFLMAAVNFAHQDSFGLGKGLNSAVTFRGGINQRGDEADRNQRNENIS